MAGPKDILKKLNRRERDIEKSVKRHVIKVQLVNMTRVSKTKSYNNKKQTSKKGKPDMTFVVPGDE